MRLSIRRRCNLGEVKDKGVQGFGRRKEGSTINLLDLREVEVARSPEARRLFMKLVT
jgi:hypothetical protein